MMGHQYLSFDHIVAKDLSLELFCLIVVMHIR